MRKIAVAVLLSALALAGCHKKNDDNPGPGPSDPTRIYYTALGASDAVGAGSSILCPPFVDCPGATGYVQRIADNLRARTTQFTLTNLGLPGAVLSHETVDLGNSVGLGLSVNFMQQEAPFVPPSTTIITVFAGANDTNTIATAIDRGAPGTTDANAFIDQQIVKFASDYSSMIATIRARAPSARIIVLNLPNFAGLPLAQGRSTRDKQWLQRLSVGFSRQGANALDAQNVTVIDTLCDARSYLPGNYSSDGFHPNDAGYLYLSGEVLRAYNAGSWPAPAASCTQMTLAPR
jgi:lysophospholipase L1-like esterase